MDIIEAHWPADQPVPSQPADPETVGEAPTTIECVDLSGNEPMGEQVVSIDFHFVWQAWQFWRWSPVVAACLCGRHGAWCRGRHGTYGAGLALVALGPVVAAAVFVADVALSGIDLHFARQMRHRPSFCVASVALMALGWLWWRAWVPWSTSTVTLRGRRGAW